jgi:PAS domain S-box-containing protein
MELLGRLFSSGGFTPHGFCYLWNPGLVWLHVVSDTLIAASYLSIPVTLIYFIRRRRDVPFHWMFVCFGAFIVACGATHVMEIWNIWHADYWVAGAIKGVTALASVATAILLIQLVPKALAFPNVNSLQRANEKLGALLQSAPEAMVIVNQDGEIILVNSQAEQLFGYPAAELLHSKIETLIPERDRGRRQNHRSEFFGDPRLRRMGAGLELYARRKDGTEFPVEISLSPLQTEEGLLVSSAIRDVTERKKVDQALGDQRNQLARSNAELTAKNKELEAFSYSVSHDLRAPLRGIDGFSQALLEDYSDRLDETGKQHLERVRAGAQRMATLIDDLLELSRITRTQIQRQPIDLSDMARSVANELSRQDPRRAVEFVIARGLQAEGDAALMRTVVENLLGNAWKFTSRRSQARIEFGRTEANGVSAFFVRDNGAGFDPALAGRLFGAFQRLHAEAEFPGSGVGLASVQRAIYRHGGRVWAESAVNQGATFFFTLLTDATGGESGESRHNGSTAEAANTVTEST